MVSGDPPTSYFTTVSFWCPQGNPIQTLPLYLLCSLNSTNRVGGKKKIKVNGENTKFALPEIQTLATGVVDVLPDGEE